MKEEELFRRKKEIEPTSEENPEDIIVLDLEKQEPVWTEISRENCILTLIRYHNQGSAMIKEGEELIEQVGGIFKQMNVSDSVDGIMMRYYIDQNGNITTMMQEKDEMGFKTNIEEE